MNQLDAGLDSQKTNKQKKNWYDFPMCPWWWEEEQSLFSKHFFSTRAKQLQSISDYVTGNDPWRGLTAEGCVCVYVHKLQPYKLT